MGKSYRNPNGYGSCYKLSGKRRKPYIARVTIGWTDEGKQLYKTLGYYETKKEGMIALASYQSMPDLASVSVTNDITFEKLYKIWSDKKYPTIGDSAVRNYKNAYNLSEALHHMPMANIKYAHLQDVIDKCNREVPTLKKIKGLFTQLFEYALKNDIVSRDYSSLVKLPKYTNKNEKIPFTRGEIEELWKNQDNDTIKVILIMIYTGFRIGELLEMERTSVDLSLRTLTGGSKTEAGKNRVVPINDRILPFIEYFHSQGYKYLLHKKKLSYWTFRSRFEQVMEMLKMKHNIHECRHTFATLMNNSGANGTSIKKLIGHTDFEFTEKVYTHKDIEELRKAINLI